MIISASRRTDIPNYYSDWFFNRIKEGYVYVRNPMNIHQVSRVSLKPDVVDGIVFWTKNPTRMINRLNELRDYVYYFQFTLNSYSTDAEPNVPSKSDVIIPVFQKLSKIIGKDKVIWRYDPIFFTEKYSIDYHVKYFGLMAAKLAPYTEKCTISFIDFYKNIQKNTRTLGIIQPTIEQTEEIAQKLSLIAMNAGLPVETCAEEIDLQKFGVNHSSCIDKSRLERIGGYTLKVEKDINQRAICGCISSIDIGAYNTCLNECLYCYANYSKKTVDNNFGEHDSSSPLLFGLVGANDVIKEREVKSCKECQISFLK